MDTVLLVGRNVVVVIAVVMMNQEELGIVVIGIVIVAEGAPMGEKVGRKEKGRNKMGWERRM
jgi:hypothetical protein